MKIENSNLNWFNVFKLTMSRIVHLGVFCLELNFKPRLGKFRKELSETGLENEVFKNINEKKTISKKYLKLLPGSAKKTDENKLKEIREKTLSQFDF